MKESVVMTNPILDEDRARGISRFMSYVLRHHPEEINLQLDPAGWADVGQLLDGMSRDGRTVTREMLDYVVDTNSKQRFVYSEDGLRIRATQSHSFDVELGYEPAEPPEILYHGTTKKAVFSIERQGLTRQKRHHVHLHVDTETSLDVGGRRGKPALLVVRALEMHQAGFKFYVSPNNVWLTDHVPPEFIDFP